MLGDAETDAGKLRDADGNAKGDVNRIAEAERDADASKRNAGGIGDARVDTRGDTTIIMGAEGGAERVGDAGGGYAGWIVDDVGTKGNIRYIADVDGDASRWDAGCIADA